MTIKAILRNGSIQPLEPLPPDWADGKELLVEDSRITSMEDLDAWMKELDDATRAVAAEEHKRFQTASEDLEVQSKDAIRREWGIP